MENLDFLLNQLVNEDDDLEMFDNLPDSDPFAQTDPQDER